MQKRRKLREVVQDRCLVLDGALGTRLEQLGERLDPILWSAGHLISNPAAIQRVYDEYLSAGANILATASYQISYEGFQQRYGMKEEKVNELFRYSVSLAEQSIRNFESSNSSKEPHFIAGSIGCYGAHLANGSEYSGGYRDLELSYLSEWHAKKLAVLSQTNVDCIAFETVPIVREVQAITQAIIQHPEAIDSWISFACQSATQLNGGEEIEDACRKIEDCDPYAFPSSSLTTTTTPSAEKNWDRIAIGVNCTAPEYVEEILHTLRDCTRKDRLLLAYPNRGDHWHEESHSYQSDTGLSAEQFATLAVKWRAAGAKIIGGCCQTTPETIAAIASALR